MFRRQLLSVSLLALGLIPSPEIEAQRAAESVCPTCARRTVDAGAAERGGSLSQVRCAEQVPLTSQIAEEFGLETLRSYLERPNVVVGHFGSAGIVETAAPAEQSATVELEFDVGEFSYYERIPGADVRCDDSVRAPARVSIRIGNGLLSFQAEGDLWKDKNEPSTHFYARADLEAAAGRYRPRLDLDRIHNGEIEVSLYAAAGHLRGDILPAVTYFRDEAQLRRYEQGHWGLGDRQLLFALGFPGDSCEDHELPVAHDEPIERLGRQSADEWRARAADLIDGTTIVDAVWKDGRETEVSVELGEPIDGNACHSASFNHLAPVSESALSIPLAGRLRSTDARLDMPIDRLTVYIDAGAVVGATLAGRASLLFSEAQREALAVNADMLLARLTYDFAAEPAVLDGIVELLAQTAPNNYNRLGCIAFPRGGKADTGTCRHE